KHEEEKERQRDRHAEQAELFADDGEDEVGVLLGKECESLLRSVQKALANPAARSDGDLRLDDVPPRIPRIDRGIQKDLQSVSLIRRKPLPQNRCEYTHE